MIEIKQILENAINIRRPKKIRGIYFLIKRNKIVYVGSGFDIRVRIEKHIADGKKSFDSYYVLEKDLARLELSKEEGIYIQHYKPIYNKKSNPDYHEGKKPIWFKYLSVKPNVADISRALNIPFQIVNGVIKETRKKEDEYYFEVINYLDSL